MLISFPAHRQRRFAALVAAVGYLVRIGTVTLVWKDIELPNMNKLWTDKVKIIVSLVGLMYVTILTWPHNVRDIITA